MRHRAAFSAVMFCLLTSLCAVVSAAAQGSNLLAPTPIATVDRPSPAALPADLVPALVKTLAQRLPSTWQATRSTHGVRLVNPAQRLALHLDKTGAHLTIRRDSTVALQLIGYSQGDRAVVFASGGMPQLDGARAVLVRGAGLTEWYVNSPLGIEQGFTLARPAHSAVTTTLRFTLHGMLKAKLRNGTLRFQNTAGKTILRYGSLYAYDADHHALPAHMTLADDHLTLIVDTRGAKYPVTVDPLFSTTIAIGDPGGTAGDNFGFSVTLSADGTTALIGAYHAANGDGAAYVYSQKSGVWSQTPVAIIADPATTTGDLFGVSVALSGDGSTALIGAQGTASYAGKAYVYRQNGGVWSTKPVASFADPAATVNDYFGNSVELSTDGAMALIGAYGTAGNAGKVYVYTQTGGSWSTQPATSFVDPSATANDYFGVCISLSSDSNTALIGAFGAAAQSGKAYVYMRAGGVWSTTPVASFADPTATPGDSFGFSAALSADASTALVGAWGTANQTGAAYAYAQNGGVWSTTPAASFTDPLVFPGDVFGVGVALSADGSTGLIGAFGSTNGHGETYVYTKSSGTWLTTPYVGFSDPGNTANDNFGQSVALSADANTALIGAFGALNSTGMAYVFASSVDISLTMTGNPASVTAGQSVIFSFSITNSDTQATASGVTLTDTLPSGMNFVSASAAGGSCSSSGSSVTCTLASLPPQGLWQPSLTVSAITAGSLVNSASVDSSQADPDTANNTASVTTAVTAAIPPPSPPSSTGGGSGGGGAVSLTGLLLLGVAAVLESRRRSSTTTLPDH